MQVLLERPDLLGRDRLQTVVGLLDSAAWPTADLVNASLVLPFLPPNAAAATWERIIASLEAGGRFAGHFIGDRVSGVNLPVRSRHSRAAVLTLLQPLDLEVFEEIERDGRTAQGHPAHWHMFKVVARRRAQRQPKAVHVQPGGEFNRTLTPVIVEADAERMALPPNRISLTLWPIR